MITVNSIAYEASHVLLSRPGGLHLICGYNSGGSQWIQLHDSASVPANTAVPVLSFIVAATSNFSFTVFNPLMFETGIVVCNSSTGPTKTLGSADCYFTAQVE